MCTRVLVCYKQNMTYSSKKLFLLKLLVNLLSPSFPERELLAHCAVENQAMKKRMGRWRGGRVGWNKPSQNLHPLCVNEMVGGQAAKSSPGRRRGGEGGLGFTASTENLARR